MPSAVFPRTLKPTSVTPLTVPTGLVSVGHTGKAQLRSVVSMGRTWTETWAGLRAGDADVESFLSWIQWAYSTSRVFTIQHMATPGSGRAPNGLAPSTVSTPIVFGGSQTGDAVFTDDWQAGVTGILREGDVIRIAGLSPLFTVIDDADSAPLTGETFIGINPPIPVGSSPVHGAAITYENNSLNAYIAAPPNLPEIPKTTALVFVGLSLQFKEAL